MGLVFAVVNQKGGVGKSTTTVNLAAYLGSRDKKTLCIDIDAQGNTTTGFGIRKKSAKVTSYDVLIGQARIQEAIIRTEFKNVSLVPATSALAGGEIEMIELEDRMNRLKMQLLTCRLDYDYILIGHGDEALKNNDGNLIDMLNKFGELLDKNNYFIISSTKHNYLGESTINPKRMVCPYINEDEKQWDFYNKWLSATLAKKLLGIEIGEGFNNPNLIRWPFERIVMINDKAHFYRVHSTFYQIPKEIADKACTMKINSYEVLKELVNVVN